MKHTGKLPSDYEACGTCGYDHGYDLPYLTETQRLEATRQHVLAALPRTIPARNAKVHP